MILEPQLKTIKNSESQGYRIYDTSGIATTQTANGGGCGAKTGLYAVPIRMSNLNPKTKLIKEMGSPADTLMAKTQQGVFFNNRVRRLTPTECEKLQGFPENFTASLSDTQRYRCLGNAVTVPVIEHIAQHFGGNHGRQ